jgi:outer membrane protein assembly factor BamB
LFIGQRKTIHGGLTQGRIRAFDASTGDSLWTYQTDNGGFYTRTFVQDGVVYGAAKGNSPLGEIVALDSETGQQIWVYNEKDRAQAQNLSMSEKNIIANTGGGLTAIEKTSGDLSWRVDWLGYGDNKPVYLEGYVYHARYSEILVIHDASGEIVHREPVPSGERYFWHLTAGADKLFAQTDATITAYEPWHLREKN